MTDWEQMSDEEFDRALTSAMEEEAKTHEGARQAEKWMSEEYPRIWHETWNAGRKACLEGVPREQNPNELRVWREVWWYGWDNYDPNPPAIFRQMEAVVNQLPTRPMKESDL